jgi:hypothetical protein
MTARTGRFPGHRRQGSRQRGGGRRPRPRTATPRRTCAPTRRPTAAPVTRTAVPSTTRSSPSSRVASPVTRQQCGFAARFFAFCSVDPAQAQDVVQDHRGQRGDARPAGRAHGGHPVRVGLREAVLHGLHTTGPAPGVLKRGSRSAVGIGGSSSALTVGTPATFRNPHLDASPLAAGVGRDLPLSHPPDVASSSNATSQRPAPAPFDRRRPRRRTGTRPGGDGGRGVPAGPHGGLGPRAGRTALQRRALWARLILPLNIEGLEGRRRRASTWSGSTAATSRPSTSTGSTRGAGSPRWT